MAFHSPEEIATVLKIKPSTLRKYSLLLEQSGYTFQKNAHGHRWFNDSDIAALRKFIAFKDSGGMTLKESAEAVYLWSKGGYVARRDTKYEAIQDVIERTESMTPEHFMSAFDEQQRTIRNMAAMLEEQTKHNTLIMQELAVTQAAIQRLSERLPDQLELDGPEPPIQHDNRSLWARIRNK